MLMLEGVADLIFYYFLLLLARVANLYSLFSSSLEYLEFISPRKLLTLMLVCVESVHGSETGV